MFHILATLTLELFFSNRAHPNSLAVFFRWFTCKLVHVTGRKVSSFFFFFSFLEYDSVVALHHLHSGHKQHWTTQPKRSHTIHNEDVEKIRFFSLSLFLMNLHTLVEHLINYCATGDARVDGTSTSTTKNAVCPCARVFPLTKLLTITAYAAPHLLRSNDARCDDEINYEVAPVRW